jgi:transketolase
VPPLPHRYPRIDPGSPRTYEVGERADNRGAFGNALLEVAEANRTGDSCPFAVFDCDLEGSVKVGAFHHAFPSRFFQAGIQEHHTATCAGALSVEGIVSVFTDFGVFGVAETYNQHRLTDINHGNLKLVCTHLGLDVGEDGRTHHSIDYVGVLRNLFGMQIIIPADPNQTDRAVRTMLSEPGMFFLGMGRSKLDIIQDENGQPFFGGDYRFISGRGDWIRRRPMGADPVGTAGAAGAVVAMGTLTGRTLQAVEKLQSDGFDLALAHLATPLHVDAAFVDELASFRYVVTVEDHNVHTGLGQSIATALFDRGVAIPHLRLGVERYSPSGSAEAVYASQGLDSAGIERRITEFRESIEQS